MHLCMILVLVCVCKLGYKVILCNIPSSFIYTVTVLFLCVCDWTNMNEQMSGRCLVGVLYESGRRIEGVLKHVGRLSRTCLEHILQVSGNLPKP